MGNATNNGLEKQLDNFDDKDRLYGLVNVKLKY
jgi:hypothetical protein